MAKGGEPIVSPLSKDPERRRRQLANLRKAPPAPFGHTRSVVHGGRATVLYRDVEAEVREVMDALAEAAPVREADGSLPDADLAAVEVAARALRRYRHVAGWCDAHGRIREKTGEVKPAAEYELSAARALAAALADLGMTPTSRAKLGVDLARGTSLADELAEARQAREQRELRDADVIDADPDDDGGEAA